MKWFNNLKIGTRLILSFAVILGALVAVSVFSMTSLNAMEQASRDMYAQNLMGVSGINDIVDSFYSLRIQVLRAVYQNFSAEGADNLAANLDSSKTEISGMIGKYKVSAENEEDRANIANAENGFGTYFTNVQKIVTDMKAGDKTAVDKDVSDAGATGDAVLKQLDTVMSFNQSYAKSKADGNSRLGGTTNTAMIAIIAGMVIIAATLAFLVTNSINKPVKKLVDAAGKLAAGDMSIRLDTGGRDEIGMLAGAFTNVIAAVTLLTEDAGMLVESASEGRLGARADASAHRGEYRRIIEGVNGMLDAVIAPVTEAASVLGEMAKGNLNASVAGNYKGDHAAIKNAVNGTIDALKSYIGEMSRVLAEMAGGNLSVGITGDFRGDFNQIKDSINNIADSLNDMLGGINSASEQVASGTQQVSAGSQALSQGATEQAGAIEQLTVTMSEIAEQTNQNAVHASRASELAAAAVSNAEEGNLRMQDMQQAMTEINEASAGISKIIKVIDEIAFQTNLLALNAAVEAARAGQHGKGFAVVAEEVRNLAQRSAGAAKETTGMIEESIKKVKAGTAMTNDTALALHNIVSGVEKAAELVSGIAKASGEQAIAVTQVNKGIEQVAQVVQTNSATAEESAAASEELSSQADMLKDMVARFVLRSQVESGAKKTGLPNKPAGMLPLNKPAAGKPKIAMNGGEFGKY